MSESLTFFVEGNPKGQPRARACIRGRHAGVYDPGTADGWKACVAEVWRNKLAAGQQPRTAATRLELMFYFPRPKGHYGSGKNAAMLKAGAPKHHTGKPDLDNLAKAVMDVLTRLGAWTDDALVTTLCVQRGWATITPGCRVTIREEGE